MKYSDQQRIVKIYEYASKLNAYIKEHHVTQEQVLTDFSLQWLITTPLYNIGEHNLIIYLRNTTLHIAIFLGT